MSFPVIINSTNYIGHNQFRISLPTTIDLNDYEVAVGSSFLYYSWYNINGSTLNNNKFTLTIPTSTTPLVLNIVIPDGLYQIKDLNNYLQYVLIQNGLYITNNTTSVNTYYAAFALSPTSYAVQFNTTALPTSLPSGYTSGGMTFPVSANQSYQLTVLSTNNLKDILGMSAGTYPSSATISGSTYTYNSDYTPNVSPISAIQMRLSCCYNPFSANSQLIHVFASNGATVGSTIDASPIQLQYVPTIGSHRELTLSFYDQLGRVLQLLDPNIIVKLIFRRQKNKP